MKRIALTSLAALSLMGSAVAGPQFLKVSDAKKAANTITAEGLKDFLTFIAADALLGRDTPSPGLDAAANFLAFNLKRWGAKPGGVNGSYFQPVRLVRHAYDKDASKIVVNGTTLKFSDDFLVSSGNGSIRGSIVYVPKKIDTFDVKGKIVVLGPKCAPQEILTAVKNGAIGTLRYDGYSAGPGGAWEGFKSGWLQFSNDYRPESEDQQFSGGGAVHALINSNVAKALGIPTDNSENTIAIDKSVELVAKATNEVTYTQNVVAIVEGSDPKLKKEYVAIGAHYDHVGGVAGGPTDRIFNGADDDGSGTVSVLSIAEAALRSPLRPKRSLIFVWHCGEEKGLWGSEYFTSHPTVPKASIVAQLNMDMVGRSRKAGDKNPRNNSLTGPKAVYVIGTTMMSTRLGDIIHSVNKGYLGIDYNKKYDDLKDPNQFFYRSDHYNYAKNGIPICFWFDGEHEDYHQVSDEVSKIDFHKMEMIARTVFVTGVAVANEPTRPKVDKPLKAN